METTTEMVWRPKCCMMVVDRSWLETSIAAVDGNEEDDDDGRRQPEEVMSGGGDAGNDPTTKHNRATRSTNIKQEVSNHTSTVQMKKSSGSGGRSLLISRKSRNSTNPTTIRFNSYDGEKEAN
ncbi:hypothetical protein E3N88_31109 [Mikania micrantha]|uniref:Uncharacterized protein n=1 Tax=Mikania micrantha TaxID=192012 RepID=A0A5N6MNH5_9ASTR|nr:hypothetical protein E3N88_31109 [Mikania micrantha]